jgi:hypothetical protein
MKPRARRIALLTVAAGCLVVAGVVAFNWPTVRDHIQAWWFVATRETRAMPATGTSFLSHEDWACFDLAQYLGKPVIFDKAMRISTELVDWRLPSDVVLLRLRENGYRIIEQRFPCRAYVVVGYPEGPIPTDRVLPPQPRPRRQPPRVEVEARLVDRP